MGRRPRSYARNWKPYDAAIAHNEFRAAHIRAGYVYVISNEGAFGKDVVKIGLTRRLEPLDRVRELGGASVPFQFDVHALFFSEDAVSLETELHHIFADRHMNHVNGRREFFFAAPHEVRTVLDERVGNLLEFVEDVEATEFRQSRCDVAWFPGRTPLLMILPIWAQTTRCWGWRGLHRACIRNRTLRAGWLAFSLLVGRRVRATQTTRGACQNPSSGDVDEGEPDRWHRVGIQEWVPITYLEMDAGLNRD